MPKYGTILNGLHDGCLVNKKLHLIYGHLFMNTVELSKAPPGTISTKVMKGMSPDQFKRSNPSTAHKIDNFPMYSLQIFCWCFLAPWMAHIPIFYNLGYIFQKIITPGLKLIVKSL